MNPTLKDYIKYLRGQPKDALVSIGAVVKRLEMLSPEPPKTEGVNYSPRSAKHPLGPEIMKLRAEGMLQREVAKKLGISKTYVSEIERSIKYAGSES
jgi:DNA-binding CsgD family transcriptional regulator